MVWHGSWDHWGGSGRVEVPSGRFGTGRGTLGEVHDGSGNRRGGLRRVKRPLGRSRTGWGTLG